ncbi:uncharacterized protein LOC129904649 [Solanum dulcamara]|uniref:uncharacterized protein LOC129904649 n=1 Tax=Solanum dulcamara TaxID=45834 RepID=UPI0024865DDF|nr:uncharacterized protein LOC129904649 [Solanum dulcamara]
MEDSGISQKRESKAELRKNKIGKGSKPQSTDTGKSLVKATRMVRTRGTTDHNNAPRPGMPRGHPRRKGKGAAPAPDPKIEPELVEEHQDTPIPTQLEGPPPPAQPPTAPVMTPAL